MELKEAMRNLDKALDDAKAALYKKRDLCLSYDEVVVYNAMSLKAIDFVKFVEFIMKVKKDERCAKNRPSPFRD